MRLPAILLDARVKMGTVLSCLPDGHGLYKAYVAGDGKHNVAAVNVRGIDSGIE